MQLLTTDCFRVARPQSALAMAEADAPPSPGAEVFYSNTFVAFYGWKDCGKACAIVVDIQVSVLRGVVTALLAAAREGEEEVRSTKIRNLAWSPDRETTEFSLCRCELGLPRLWLALQVAFINIVNDITYQLDLGDRPLLVFTEWLAALAAEKQGEVMIC